MDYRSFPVQVRALDGGGDEGIIEGMACVFGVVDDWGTTFDRGCFKKSLRENPEIVILWSHDRSEPIGITKRGMAEETDEGLFVRGELNLEIQRAREVYSNAKRGIVRGISIGFRPVQDKIKIDDSKTTHFKEVKLIEWSPVALGHEAVPGANISKVRALPSLETILRALDDIQNFEYVSGLSDDLIQRCIKKLEALRMNEPPNGTRALEPPIVSNEPDLHSLLDAISKFNRNYRS